MLKACAHCVMQVKKSCKNPVYTEQQSHTQFVAARVASQQLSVSFDQEQNNKSVFRLQKIHIPFSNQSFARDVNTQAAVSSVEE